MATLLDIVNKRQSSLSPVTQPLGPSQTSQLQQLSQATSGRAPTQSTGPRMSNVGEQLANQQTQLQLQQVAQAEQQGQQQVQQQAEQVVKEEQLVQRDMTEQSARFMDQLMNDQLGVLQQFSKGEKQLNLKKDKARLEQIGFTLRLNNDKYINKLQEEGFRARLDNEAVFEEELARSIFAEELDLFRDNLDFRAMMGASDRDFQEQVASMDLNSAIELANASAQSAASQQMWSGIGTMVSGGVGAYGASSGAQPTTQQNWQAKMDAAPTLNTQTMQPGNTYDPQA